MRSMLLEKVQIIDSENREPLRMREIEIPEPEQNEILIKIAVCGVCHTELDEIEGRTSPETFPVIPGHQVVGTVEQTGRNVSRYHIGDRVGVAWIYSSCGNCRFCTEGMENLCDKFLATGRDANGGYAEYMVINENYAYMIPNSLEDSKIAPMLCAGAIGYRSLKLCNLNNGDPLGLMGFGASAHLVIKLVKVLYPRSSVYVFARSEEQREFARDLGAEWSGDIVTLPPVGMKAIIDTTPVWKPVVESMNKLDKGGRLVINAIRKEDYDIDYLQNIEYGKHIWNEKEIKSVANVTRNDVKELIECAAKHEILPEVTEYPLEKANEALLDLKKGSSKGAKVLVMK